jgi:hypothetical protein
MPKKQTKTKPTKRVVSGTGGLKNKKKFNWKKLLPIVLPIAIIGGFFVYRSFALTYERVFDVNAKDPRMEGGILQPKQDGVYSRYIDNNLANNSPTGETMPDEVSVRIIPESKAEADELATVRTICATFKKLKGRLAMEVDKLDAVNEPGYPDYKPSYIESQFEAGGNICVPGVEIPSQGIEVTLSMFSSESPEKRISYGSIVDVYGSNNVVYAWVHYASKGQVTGGKSQTYDGVIYRTVPGRASNEEWGSGKISTTATEAEVRASKRICFHYKTLGPDDAPREGHLGDSLIMQIRYGDGFTASIELATDYRSSGRGYCYPISPEQLDHAKSGATVSIELLNSGTSPIGIDTIFGQAGY